MNIQDYMPTSEAAAALDVGTQRVRDLIASGRLRAVKMGKFWLVHRADVATFEPAKPWGLTSPKST